MLVKVSLFNLQGARSIRGTVRYYTRFPENVKRISEVFSGLSYLLVSVSKSRRQLCTMSMAIPLSPYFVKKRRSQRSFRRFRHTGDIPFDQ